MTPVSLQHSFAIMAYKEAPYLEETVQSILNQTNTSQVYMMTSTPSEHIVGIAGKYNIPLHINKSRAGIAGDWEYALSRATTPLVTLVHQDDRYYPTYAQAVLDMFERHPDILIFFTDYKEIDGKGMQRKTNRTLMIKRILLWPFLFRESLRSRFWKKAILSLGNPICAPSVTYHLENLHSKHLFEESYGLSLDWEAWLNIAEKPGSFCYRKESLLEHRIHQNAETSNGITDGRRANEDLRLFQRIWPNWIAGLLAKLYCSSYGTNV